MTARPGTEARDIQDLAAAYMRGLLTFGADAVSRDLDNGGAETVSDLINLAASIGIVYRRDYVTDEESRVIGGAMAIIREEFS